MACTTKKALVPVANGTEPKEAVITIDVLRRGGVEVTVASVEEELSVEFRNGLKIVADCFIEDCSDVIFDLINLPGGLAGVRRMSESRVLERMVKKQASQGRLVAAICAAPPFVLAPWGLLHGLKATCYPTFMEQLSRWATAVESRVVQDANVTTSRGPGTTMEYSLHLLQQLHGNLKLKQVSAPLLMRPNHGEEYFIRQLNPVDWTFKAQTPRILVPIARGTEEMEVAIIVNVLRCVKAKVTVASIHQSLQVVASAQVKLVADMILDDALKLSYDLILLPGGLGGATEFAKCDRLVNILRKQMESNLPYGAICESPALVLEPHGLLKGKKATAFPAFCHQLSDASETENRVVVDRNLITSRGLGTAMEFAFAIVDKFYGSEKALQLAKTMLFVDYS